MAQKTTRSINWDEEEKQLLRDILKDYIEIIGSKSLSFNANKLKIIAWSDVHSRFNSVNSRGRSVKQLQMQWKTMKVECRKHLTAHKVELQQTGGGPKPKSPTLQGLEVASMVPGELTRTTNRFDYDGSISINVINASYILQPGNNADDLANNEVLLDDEAKQAHLTIHSSQGPSTSSDRSTPEASTSQHTQPSRIIIYKAKNRGTKNKWDFKKSMFLLARKYKELDRKLKMKESERKLEMLLIEHDLKVEIKKKQLDDLENKQ